VRDAPGGRGSRIAALRAQPYATQSFAPFDKFVVTVNARAAGLAPAGVARASVAGAAPVSLPVLLVTRLIEQASCRWYK
jgi:hypothetical protein